MRIISTVPSITELLADLGLDNEVVGITKFCIHPKNWYRNKERIGGTKNLNIDKIKSLSPTLVICNKEENVKEQIETLSTFCKVHLTDIKSPDDNLQLITELGNTTDRRLTALRLKAELELALQQIATLAETTALYLIWKDPYMTVGNDTYIHAFMQKCGLKNVYSHKQRYPETTIKTINELNPKLVLLSSEPYPFKEKDLKAFKALIPKSNIHLVDGEVFSWYGTRLIKKLPYLNKLLAELNS